MEMGRSTIRSSVIFCARPRNVLYNPCMLSVLYNYKYITTWLCFVAALVTKRMCASTHGIKAFYAPSWELQTSFCRDFGALGGPRHGRFVMVSVHPF